jgi:hypothetical protein
MSKPKTLKSEELDALLSSIASDISTVSFHWRLWNDLWKAMPKYREEFSQSPAFWFLTLNAHKDAALFRLGRLYDQMNGALSLKSLVALVAANAALFEEPHFRERLKENPFVDSLAESIRTPGAATLEADLKAVNETSDELVEKLVNLRNQVLAHSDQRVALGRIRHPGAQLTNVEIDSLLARAVSISNRYTSLFKASTDVQTIVGQDDYLRVLESVRKDIEAQERAMQQELATFQSQVQRPEVF